jgi:hypothetical protein
MPLLRKLLFSPLFSIELAADDLCLEGSEEFFYQLALRQFGNLGHIKLNPPPSLRSLLKIAVAAEDTSASPLDKPQLVEVSINITLLILILNIPCPPS